MRTYRTDLVGKVFGLLTVKSYDHTNKWKQTVWNCDCQCGAQCIVRSDALRRGHKRSCGNIRKHFSTFQSKNWKGHGEVSLSYFNALKNEGEKRGYDFTISISYIWELFLEQGRRCALTSLPLNFKTLKKNYDGTASLDRIDNHKGYVEGNVQWVHKEINFMKGSLSIERLKELCDLVTKNVPLV